MLSKSLQDKDKNVRIALATALGEAGPEAIPMLSKSLQDEDNHCSHRCRLGLGGNRGEVS